MLLLERFELTLSDVFKIEGGIKVQNWGELRKVKMINPSMIPKLDYHPIIEEFAEIKTSNAKTERFLLPNDYLIASKQNIKGYSLMNTDNIDGNNIVASEHFLVLRYKPTWNAIFGSSYIVHNLLDILVKKLAIEKSKKFGAQKYITIEDVANSKISFNLNGNNEIDENYKNVKKLIRKEIEGINQFKLFINNYIVKNKIEIKVDESEQIEKKAKTNKSTGEYEFYIKLGVAYFNQPFINIKKINQDFFGEHLSQLDVHLGNWDSVPINSKINRKANPNQTPRIIFEGSDYNRYIQANHEMGDLIKVSFEETKPVKRILIS